MFLAKINGDIFQKNKPYFGRILDPFKTKSGNFVWIFSKYYAKSLFIITTPDEKILRKRVSKDGQTDRITLKMNKDE